MARKITNLQQRVDQQRYAANYDAIDFSKGVSAQWDKTSTGAMVRGKRRKPAGLWSKPFHSTALGVGVNQIDEAREHLRANNCTADFAPNGDLIVTSEKQYREVGRITGMYSGRDGWEARDDSGARIFTGREAAESRKRIKNHLEKLGY